MYQTLLLSSSLLILHVTASPQFHGHHGRRVCGREVRHSSVAVTTESFVQPVHKPYITLCQGHRLCSTYKTVYRVAYRQVTRASPVSHTYPECCPGWQRLHSHNCNHAVCGQSCVNGGTCLTPNHCACPLGWMGRHCETDMDECSERQPCGHRCVNVPGSYRCACREGYRLTGDRHSCENLPPPAPPAPPTRTSQAEAKDNRTSSTFPGGGFGLAENITEEVQSLKNRVELLEQKLQLVLAPVNSLFPMSLDEGVSEKTSFLSHSFQQLDRIDSLSEQIGFLEERLGTCEWTHPSG
ncbi:epidermal growth factor-like protein 7 isoform X1 [Esox lucius]|uniref:epidermal growth factor-like protein 7 isoform X1 n=1 Tax=Esox lucius TaxID=8010 RepID=UPI0014773E18|nr:epidermal growth factor-like protein 7 isoform X1 [Esox lucius]XP_010876591.2 epidermal growth factor-like protein 7 isoform X1 [Esox lucius]XP_019908992.2 epidermal growth factor-like protein 7 isoform X1 [Esox lucius]